MTGYPRTVAPGWLAPLIDFEAPIELSLHVHPLETGQMVGSLTHKMVQLHSSRLLEARGGRLADPEREVAYEDAERLRDALQRGEEKVFSVGLYVLLRASSRGALDDLTRRVEVTLDGMLAHSRVAIFEQDAGFRSCLPEASGPPAGLPQPRHLSRSRRPSRSPRARLTMETRRPLRHRQAQPSPVIFDPFDPSLENANAGRLRQVGRREELLHQADGAAQPAGRRRLPGDRPRGRVPRALRRGRRPVRPARQHVGQHLNPFDLPPPDDDGRAATRWPSRSRRLLGLLEIMLAEPGRPLGPYERALLDRALYRTYAATGITADPATHDTPGAAAARPPGGARW